MMIEGLSLTVIMSVVSMLGLPGLILIFWYVDQRCYERDRKELIERDARRDQQNAERDTKRDAQHLAEITIMKEQFTAGTALYEKRFEAVVRMYEDNVLLVKGSTGIPRLDLFTLQKLPEEAWIRKAIFFEQPRKKALYFLTSPVWKKIILFQHVKPIDVLRLLMTQTGKVVRRACAPLFVLFSGIKNRLVLFCGILLEATCTVR